MADDAIIGLVVALIMGGIPFTILGAMLIQRGSFKLKLQERQRARDAYKELLLEKLDIIKTAIAMGYQQSDLRELDRQLEEHLGAERMQALLATGESNPPANPARLLDLDVAGTSSAAQRLGELEK